MSFMLAQALFGREDLDSLSGLHVSGVRRRVRSLLAGCCRGRDEVLLPSRLS